MDVWSALAVGADGVTDPVREWLPTTERSLLWNDRAGHMWKLITSGRWLQSGAFEATGECQGNRFHRNGTQYMDTFNQCAPAPGAGDAATLVSCTNGAGVRHGELTVPPSCAVCTNSTPCLFDVLTDPRETDNVAAAHPELVRTLATKLADFNIPYILTGPGGTLTPANLACYNCSESDNRGVGKFGDFWGPCCTART